MILECSVEYSEKKESLVVWALNPTPFLVFFSLSKTTDFCIFSLWHIKLTLLTDSEHVWVLFFVLSVTLQYLNFNLSRIWKNYMILSTMC